MTDTTNPVCEEMETVDGLFDHPTIPTLSEEEENLHSLVVQRLAEDEEEHEEEDSSEPPTSVRYRIDVGTNGGRSEDMLLLYIYGGNQEGIVDFMHRLEDEQELILSVNQVRADSDLFNLAASLCLEVTHVKGTPSVPLMSGSKQLIPLAQRLTLDKVRGMVGEDNVYYRPAKQEYVVPSQFNIQAS